MKTCQLWLKTPQQKVVEVGYISRLIPRGHWVRFCLRLPGWPRGPGSRQRRIIEVCSWAGFLPRSGSLRSIVSMDTWIFKEIWRISMGDLIAAVPSHQKRIKKKRIGKESSTPLTGMSGGVRIPTTGISKTAASLPSPPQPPRHCSGWSIHRTPKKNHRPPATYQPYWTFVLRKQLEIDISEFKRRSVFQLQVCPAVNKVHEAANCVQS